MLNKIVVLFFLESFDCLIDDCEWEFAFCWKAPARILTRHKMFMRSNQSTLER